MIQSMAKHMVEKVEMNVVMLMTGIKKRADVDEFVRNVDGELSDVRVSASCKHDRVRSYMSEACAGGALTKSRQQQCATQLDFDKRAGELSTETAQSTMSRTRR